MKNITLSSQTGNLIDNITKRFLIGIRESNPNILTMFRDRDVLPYRQLSAWSGEFAGKYLTGCAYVYKLNKDNELYKYVLGFIDELISYQDTDGYLGCFQRECRLTGMRYSPKGEKPNTWDAWNHYHIMYGLLLWYDIVRDERYFSTVERIADMFIKRFYCGNPKISTIGSIETNLSVYHIFSILFRRTGDKKYLDFAKEVELDIETDGGDYMNFALQGGEFYQCRAPRWESVHTIMGYLEIYRITGDADYLNAVIKIYRSILKTDVHNTGAFSTNERALGNPYEIGNIETCCVIAFNALAIELYDITKDPEIIDFLEISHYNAVLGYNSPSGAWSTYSTPMDGEKMANYHAIGFQSRPGAPNINCCSVNAARGVAAIGDWIISYTNDGTVYINSFESLSAELGTARVKISGNYPADGNVKITLDGDLTAAIRIPAWSKNTSVTVNDKAVKVCAGEYFTVSVNGNAVVELFLDFTPYTIFGGDDYEGKISVYAGPVLYGLENTENPSLEFDANDFIDRIALKSAIPEVRADGSIILKINDVVLKDFYHLGIDGGKYRTWL